MTSDTPGVRELKPLTKSIEMRDFLLFVPRKMRLPDELRLQLRGRFRRRIDALWNGCIYVV